MTIEPVIQRMKQLQHLHESLLFLSKKKTETLKTNDLSEIQQLLTQERKHVQAIEKIEKQRVQSVTQWAQERDLKAREWTVSEMIDRLEGKEKENLMNIYEKLILVLSDLKQQEKLNTELTQHSLKFINMSLDLFQPSIQSVNYGRKQGYSNKRSVFDSKA
ncbi:FlgN protein [Halobacillus karajensis]|uniref:FlgN protein n=1 Tax=Halobacillus karajensis TaxID=195088 RepID=A0A059NWI7_9BACI|nr:flagellar protein FlgN [Halobacillus karajensis]CDQ19207.1 FlgN protein [Halobacillus karajensis]CDQ22719.1 FlgN protein [Halobacillus karajensis]CDQ26201.1 FlgN protein [Halobacillus karajensis]SEH40060.1 FlgN protein [Halobacillus karajensis]